MGVKWKFAGKNLLKTGLRYPILNEIFLAPGMMRPNSYYQHIYPSILAVQRRVGIELSSNCFTFMGLPDNRESQKLDKALYIAFFGVGESIDAVAKGAQYRVPGYPYPAAPKALHKIVFCISCFSDSLRFQGVQGDIQKQKRNIWTGSRPPPVHLEIFA